MGSLGRRAWGAAHSRGEARLFPMCAKTSMSAKKKGLAEAGTPGRALCVSAHDCQPPKLGTHGPLGTHEDGGRPATAVRPREGRGRPLFHVCQDCHVCQEKGVGRAGQWQGGAGVCPCLPTVKVGSHERFGTHEEDGRTVTAVRPRPGEPERGPTGMLGPLRGQEESFRRAIGWIRAHVCQGRGVGRAWRP
jgi:hypothetical protein